MDRLIIEKTEGRIMLGIVMFVTLMILVGWIAINEPARMAAFEEQHTARSIERGAELYAASCSTCHGVAGYGQTGVAPALNNPHLFGYDYFADLTDDLNDTLRQIDEHNTTLGHLADDRGDVMDAVLSASEEEQPALLEQVAEIDAEIETAQTELAELEANVEPLIAQIDTRMADLSQATLRGYYPSWDVVRPSVDAGGDEEGNYILLVNYLREDANRLSQIAWGSSLDAFILTTLNHGRPGSNDVWTQDSPMAAWSQRGGGPLRDDEVRYIVSYIMNWDKGDNWTVDDLNNVTQFARLHVAYTGEVIEGVDPIGTDVEAIVAELPNYTGDAAHGEQLYTGMAQTELNQIVGCSACHAGGAIGPNTEGTFARVEADRLPALDGYTVEQYIVESIVLPGDYTVAGFTGQMPAIYGDQMSHQDLADILAYLASQ